MKILVVEDDKKLSEAICDILKNNDYMVDAVYNGMDGFYYASNNDYDSIVLDVMMPKMDGFEVIKLLRGQKNTTPTLMLTAKSELSDRVKGLDLGADDYLVKPFFQEELLARIRAISRRTGEVAIDELSFGDLNLNLNTPTITCGSKSLTLSNTEFKLLKVFMRNNQNILSKDTLIEKVWGYDSDTSNNKIEVYISYIRKKLFYIGSKVNIKSIRLMGYILEIMSDD